MQLFTALLTALALVSSTTALPVAVAHDASRRSENIVYSPLIKSPSQGSVWKVGSKQVVTWDASNVPSGAEGNKGTIMLGYGDNTGSEHLDYSEFHSADPAALTQFIVGDVAIGSVLTCYCVEHPLADGFLLTTGKQSITVPNVPKKSTYFVAGK
jgi:hypothetical protein